MGYAVLKKSNEKINLSPFIIRPLLFYFSLTLFFPIKRHFFGGPCPPLANPGELHIKYAKLSLTYKVYLCRITTMVYIEQNKHEPRLTLQGMKVLQAFVDNPSIEISGADIQRLTGLFSGTLYPILLRFENAGWLNSRWEQVEPSKVGRPRRRLYRILSTGLAKANEVFDMFAHGVLA